MAKKAKLKKLYFPTKKVKIDGRMQPSIWEADRPSMSAAIEMSIASLKAYAEQYSHWGIAYSGGKDSSATTSFVIWAVQNGLVKKPESLTVLYADTRQELPHYLIPLRDLWQIFEVLDLRQKQYYHRWITVFMYTFLGAG